MSYSFSVKAKTHHDAIHLAGEQFTAIADAQPAHEQDVDIAEEALGSLLSVVKEPGEDEQVAVTVAGSLTWRAEGEFTGATLSITVATVKE